MKTYPSISKFPKVFKAHLFDKLDGSNLRFEWSKKRGWYKFGTRRRLFDESDSDFGDAILLFRQEHAEALNKIFRSQGWDRVVVFAEYWGENSFAGLHEPNDPKHLTIFDIAPHKRGIIPPKVFRSLFEDKVETPKYLGEYKWTPGLLDQIKNEEIEGVTFEGVVGKAVEGRKLVMAKAKTNRWIKRVKELYPDKANSILES